MQPYWKTLGLDAPPDDLKAVKRAYAAKLKVTRPDDDPQAFMELRDAFEVAKSQFSQTVSTFSEYLQEDKNSPPVFTVEAESLEAQTIENTESRYHTAIQDILNNPRDRNNFEVWTCYIDSVSRESSLDEYVEFDHTLRETLLERLGYYDGDNSKRNFAEEIPTIETPVAATIFRLMDWTEPQNHDYPISDELEWLLQDFRLIKLNRVTRTNVSQEIYKDRHRRHEEAYKNSGYVVLEKFMIIGIFGIIALVLLITDSF